MVPPSGREGHCREDAGGTEKYGYTSKQDKVFLQCFDAAELKRIKTELEPKMGMDLNLVQLIAYTDWNETGKNSRTGSG